MKRKHWTIVILFLCVFWNISAQQKSLKSFLNFEEKEIDLGKVVINKEVNCIFEFENTGKESLIITRVSASCGCTTPEWTKAPIKKGKKGSLKVVFKSSKKGVTSKSITVYSTAENSPVKLIIKGVVVENNNKDK